MENLLFFSSDSFFPLLLLCLWNGTDIALTFVLVIHAMLRRDSNNSGDPLITYLE